MPVRSMTGYAQVSGQVGGQLGFSLSLKSVNHRFLDLHFRLPSDNDGMEMKLRRVLKERLSRGHIELTLNLERAGGTAYSLNRELVAAYIRAFRDAAREFGIVADPDLNAILRIPGAMDASGSPADGEFESVVLVTVDKALARLNEMREEEGRSIDLELRERMAHIEKARAAVAQHRSTVLDSYAEKLKSRLHELAGTQLDPDRIAQEVALLVDRSDVQEELVRLHAHVKHFLALLDQGGEIGKKLDFLLQEMNRESNTLLSKTSGLAGEALNITERGLAIKSEIEKAREQVQNLE
ncbi:MAG: YicC family protein [Acidobacteria bacterium]|nr:YicC family protein [Acidobacteriota bacterium]